MLAAAVVIAAVSASAQLALVPQARSAYLLRSGSPYSPLERQQADEMFARYRREGKPGEPVIASTMVFRYAHDRNLFWLDRLHGRPRRSGFLAIAATIKSLSGSAQTQ
jgi:hypothetical protein